MRRGAQLGPLAAGVLLAALVAGCDSDDPVPYVLPDGTDVARFRFLAFKTAEEVEGGEVALDSLRGSVVLLNLVGTWSADCRDTAPIMVSLYHRYYGEDFEIIGLAYEQTDDADQARQAVSVYREEFSIPYRLAIGPEVLWQELERYAKVSRRLPTLVLVDRRGVARHVFEGLAPGSEQTLAEEIETLLEEPYAPDGSGEAD
ncbi:MAG: TlpA family protein disulfide reductase [Planctomycetes bacterium]|nr:TlpA family protein disulfide reductase [Planctomycetota bacterium]